MRVLVVLPRPKTWASHIEEGRATLHHIVCASGSQQGVNLVGQVGHLQGTFVRKLLLGHKECGVSGRCSGAAYKPLASGG
jgi:hypothetical protein